MRRCGETVAAIGRGGGIASNRRYGQHYRRRVHRAVPAPGVGSWRRERAGRYPGKRLDFGKRKEQTGGTKIIAQQLDSD